MFTRRCPWWAIIASSFRTGTGDMGYAAVESVNDTVLECVSPQTYRGIMGALKSRHVQPSYSRGRLQLPTRIEGVSWNAYKQFLAAWGDQHVRHIYDQGLLEI